MKVSRFFTFSFLFLLHHASEAKVIHVPKDYDSIQRAIDSSRRNDIIQVAPGTYYENIKLKDGRSLIGAGAEITFIVDQGKGPPDPVVYIDGDVTIKGFTVTGGRGAGVGHAVMVTQGSARIIDNIIRDNSYTGLGVHSEVSYTAPIIVGNKIFGNGGAGIATLGRYGRPVIKKNELFNNTNVGIACTDHAAPLIIENNIYNNGAGIGIKDEADAELIKNVVVGNKMVGINVSKKAKGTLRNNNIMTNGSTGINIDQSPFSILEKNTVVDNGAEGIYIKNNSFATIHNNIITGNLPIVVQISKSIVTMTNNQIYAKDQGSINTSAVRAKKSKLFIGGNEIIGGLDAEEGSTVVQLSSDKQTPPPPSVIERKIQDALASSSDEHSKEDELSSSETTTETKPKVSRSCLFFF